MVALSVSGMGGSRLSASMSVRVELVRIFRRGGWARGSVVLRAHGRGPVGKARYDVESALVAVRIGPIAPIRARLPPTAWTVRPGSGAAGHSWRMGSRFGAVAHGCARPQRPVVGAVGDACRPGRAAVCQGRAAVCQGRAAAGQVGASTARHAGARVVMVECRSSREYVKYRTRPRGCGQTADSGLSRPAKLLMWTFPNPAVKVRAGCTPRNVGWRCDRPMAMPLAGTELPGHRCACA